MKEPIQLVLSAAEISDAGKQQETAFSSVFQMKAIGRTDLFFFCTAKHVGYKIADTAFFREIKTQSKVIFPPGIIFSSRPLTPAL